MKQSNDIRQKFDPLTFALFHCFCVGKEINIKFYVLFSKKNILEDLNEVELNVDFVCQSC